MAGMGRIPDMTRCRFCFVDGPCCYNSTNVTVSKFGDLRVGLMIRAQHGHRAKRLAVIAVSLRRIVVIESGRLGCPFVRALAHGDDRVASMRPGRPRLGCNPAKCDLSARRLDSLRAEFRPVAH